MAADFAIHCLDNGATERDLAEFMSHTFGSKYFRFGLQDHDAWDKSCVTIGETSHVFVGEVSFLKAAILNDSDTYIPGAIEQIGEIVGEDLPPIDDSLIERISEALGLPNSTQYSLTEPHRVVAFLQEHKGKKAFTVAW